MTNRQKVRQAFESKATQRLRDEVAYFMDTYSDSPQYMIADAINDALNHAEANDDKPMARDCINVLIAAGYYEPRDLSTVVMGRDRAPVRKGMRYDCVEAWCVWIEN